MYSVKEKGQNTSPCRGTLLYLPPDSHTVHTELLLHTHHEEPSLDVVVRKLCESLRKTHLDFNTTVVKELILLPPPTTSPLLPSPAPPRSQWHSLCYTFSDAWGQQSLLNGGRGGWARGPVRRRYSLYPKQPLSRRNPPPPSHLTRIQITLLGGYTKGGLGHRKGQAGPLSPLATCRRDCMLKVDGTLWLSPKMRRSNVTKLISDLGFNRTFKTWGFWGLPYLLARKTKQKA